MIDTNIIQIFSLATGIIYMIMQIFQHKWMWYFDILTLGSALIVAGCNFSDGVWAPLWAQVATNSYFLVMAVIGIFTWKRLGKTSEGQIHLVKVPRNRYFIYAGLVIFSAPLVCLLLKQTNDPAPIVDGISLAFGLMAAWFLTKSHIEQWLLWIVADIFAIAAYASQSAWWMVALYSCYIISSIIGFRHWRKKGIVIE